MSRMTTSGLRLSARASPSFADSAVSTSTEARAKARRKAWRMEGSSSTIRRVDKEYLPQAEGIANCKLAIANCKMKTERFGLRNPSALSILVWEVGVPGLAGADRLK